MKWLEFQLYGGHNKAAINLDNVQLIKEFGPTTTEIIFTKGETLRVVGGYAETVEAVTRASRSDH
jgi:hypothetical protein